MKNALSHHHHHYVVLSARISMTLSCHPFAIHCHPLLPAECLQGYILYRHRAVVYRFYLVAPTFAGPCDEVHSSISLMNSSLLLQQCPACSVPLTLIVFVIGIRWPYSSCFVGCCLKDLFNIEIFKVMKIFVPFRIDLAIIIILFWI